MKGKQQGKRKATGKQLRRMPAPVVRPPSPPIEREKCPICWMHIPSARFEEHVAECQRRRAMYARLEAATPAVAKPAPEKTDDGYRIARCHLCRRRICLVPEGIGHAYYTITRQRKGELHVCNGRSTGGRRSKLVYVNPAVGLLKESRPKRPKYGGPRGV